LRPWEEGGPRTPAVPKPPRTREHDATTGENATRQTPREPGPRHRGRRRQWGAAREAEDGARDGEGGRWGLDAWHYSRTVPTRLERFLAAEDLDEVADLAISDDQLADDEIDAIRSVVTDGERPLALRNLLLYPDMLPTDLVVRTLTSNLLAPDGPLLLAAVVGSHRSSSRLGDGERELVVERLFQLLGRSQSAVTRERTAAALVSLAATVDVPSLLPLLADDDSVIRHNVRAAIVRTLGAREAQVTAERAEATGSLPHWASQFLEEGLDQGRASVDDLLMRGVLAPQLVSLPSMDL
jgi:hypothetical protein